MPGSLSRMDLDLHPARHRPLTDQASTSQTMGMAPTRPVRPTVAASRAAAGWLWLTLAALPGGCAYTVDLGTQPAPPPQRLDGCLAMVPADRLDLGSQVVGRPVRTSVVVRNCLTAARTLRVELGGQVEGWWLTVATAADGQTVTLAAGDQVRVDLEFAAQSVGQSAASVRASFPDETVELPLFAAGMDAPVVAPRMSCAGGATRTVVGDLVLGPDVNPAAPAVALALYGLQPADCFVVTGNLTVIGAPLPDLNVLGGLLEVRGNLSVGTGLGGNPSLMQVDGLRNLKSVGGDLLVLGNPRLESVDGLVGLTRVGGSLTVQENRSLFDLAGLRAVREVGGSILVQNNRRLSNLRGLGALSEVPSDLTVAGNLALTDLAGLSGINRVGGALSVAFNDALKSVQGLSGLRQVGGYLGVEGNRSLGSLAGLQGISEAGQVVVSQNTALLDLDGLRSLTHARSILLNHLDALASTGGLRSLHTVDDHMIIQSNQSLASLKLDALTRVGGLLGIRDNPRLPTSEAHALADRLGASADIARNGEP